MLTATDKPETVANEKTGEAAREWDRITAAMDFEEKDRSSLATYCVAWARWVDAETKLAELGPIVKSPSGFPLVNPYLTVSTTAAKQCQSLAKQLGMATKGKQPRPLSTGTPAVRLADEPSDDVVDQMLAGLGRKVQ